MTSRLRQLTGALRGRRALQPFWEALYRQALNGMNVGGGGEPDHSGEVWVLRHLERLRTANAVVFDVGANVGAYALAVATHTPPTTRLHCFEPSRRTFGRLRSALQNVPQATCHPFGFGERDELVTLYSDRAESGLASVYPRRLDHHGILLVPSEQVALKTIDSFCRSAEISRIDLLKLDVEGQELNVLRGASDMLSRGDIGAIQFEFGGCNIDSRTYFQDFYYLLNPAYRMFRVLVDGLKPIERYSEQLELFVTTNYLAVQRNATGS